MRNVLISLFSLTCIYLLWPYIAVFSLYVALQTGDIVGVEERVDWSSFKKDLRVDLDNLVEVKLKESLNKKEMQLNFDSMTLSKQVSDKIATPEGLIYLFNKPDELLNRFARYSQTRFHLKKLTHLFPKKNHSNPRVRTFRIYLSELNTHFLSSLTALG